MKEKQRTTHKSMLGKEFDMHKLAMKNEMTVAVGNAKVNARGDELGPGGKIIRRREEVLRQSMSNRPDEHVTKENITNVKNVDDMNPEGNE